MEIPFASVAVIVSKYIPGVTPVATLRRTYFEDAVVVSRVIPDDAIEDERENVYGPTPPFTVTVSTKD